MVPQDVGSERAVLAGICKFGEKALIDVGDIITESSFVEEANQLLYTCLKQALEHYTEIDIGAIVTTAQQLGIYDRLVKQKHDMSWA